MNKYSIAIKEKQNVEVKEVDFERIQMNIDVLSKGVDFYNELRNKYTGLSKFNEKKIDSIISSIIKLEDLSEDTLTYEKNIMMEIRKQS
ncbi:MAG: hypothetical protein IPH04_04165 [Saprospirales bacterium]|nr:hypothetical protein [Saprospirales bacterium]